MKDNFNHLEEYPYHMGHIWGFWIGKNELLRDKFYLFYDSVPICPFWELDIAEGMVKRLNEERLKGYEGD